MTYQPQPGTIAVRVIAWLKLQESGAEFAAAVICDALRIDSTVLAASMRMAREAGLVHARPMPGHRRHLLWSLGDGTTATARPADYEPDEPLNRPAPPVRPGPFLPGVPATQSEPSGFRVLRFGEQLMVSGMEIRDEVVIFTPEQVGELLRQARQVGVA